MLASDLVRLLQDMIQKHGDLPVVTGVDFTGYGAPAEKVVLENKTRSFFEDKLTPVFDIVFSEDSLVQI